MGEKSYFDWLVSETPTTWWHDSGDPDELDAAIAMHTSGVTTNPVLTARAVSGQPAYWSPKVGSLDGLNGTERAIAMTKAVVLDAVAKMTPIHERTQAAEGYVCAQVNPRVAGDRETMLAMARHFASWAPNIAVKLPVTAAGLDVLEQCIAEGITVTATVSFCVPQVVAIAERHRAGAARARAAGITPGHCFSVIMIGRLDDYLWDVARDRKADISESDIQQAGLAATKRAYSIYKERGYEAVLLIAALRGTYHMTEVAGAEFIVSIHPRYQAMLLAEGVPQEPRIDVPVPGDVIDRLVTLPEFVRSYEPDGMAPTDFITYGATQKTLSQFDQVGWSLIESYDF